MEKILTAALKYAESGFSVIPVQRNKKPFIAWEKYQHERATPDQIREWWQKYPNANVAIVTGGISGLNVVDFDSPEARETIEEKIPQSLIYPISTTPRKGWHYYFQSQNGLGNSIGFIDHADFRGEGGYIIAPPSEGYTWLPNLSIDEVQPCEMPDAIKELLTKQTIENPTIKPLDFNKGARDDSLFHMALSMARGGMAQAAVATAVLQFARSCKPPFSAQDALRKVESAFDRLKNKERNLTQEVRDWIESTEGEFYTRDVFEILDIAKDQKQKVSIILTRLISEGLIERTGKRTGCFRRIENELPKMDIFNANTETVDIKLPFGIHNLVNLMPGNIAVISGSKDAGKTSLLLNIIKDNMDKFNIQYFNSEMGEGELRRRLELFEDVPFADWKAVNFYERDQNFHDVIVPGKGNINIIDFLEIYEDFWIARKWIAQIWRKLEGAIAIIGIQKPPGRDFALGGAGTIEKARLYLALESGNLKIVSAKNWKGSENPKGKTLKYKIVSGCKLIQVDDWSNLD